MYVRKVNPPPPHPFYFFITENQAELLKNSPPASIEQYHANVNLSGFVGPRETITSTRPIEREQRLLQRSLVLMAANICLRAQNGPNGLVEDEVMVTIADLG